MTRLYCRKLVILLAIGWLGYGANSLYGQGAGWLTFEKCPVMVEHRVEIPAQERGFLKALTVEQNQSVAAGELLAELDTDLAELELQIAQLERTRAEELARDESSVKYQQVALQKVEEELASHRSISKSVSDSEIRRLTLGVEQAKLELVRATHVHSRALSEVKLKSVAVEVAQLRLTRRRIVAPRNGVVTSIKIHPGQSVEAGQTILEIEDLEQLIIDRLVPSAQVNVAELVGCEVRVDLEQAEGAMLRFAGRVTSYDPHVSSSGLVRVHARVKNIQQDGHWLLLPGREVTMHVAQGGNSRSDQAKASVLPDRKIR
ncbi:MAG: HlyD family efflux transporter periplasmic adaptor subunit [Pirellulaceae bacterium]|jgi:HlyD family secretion protein|nr:HlyD family efflux transporter periplasmic adaptor subunit [Pirellulaceae bacterium]